MFSRIFIERPRLAMVVSIIITLAGVLAPVSYTHLRAHET